MDKKKRTRCAKKSKTRNENELDEWKKIEIHYVQERWLAMNTEMQTNWI